MDEQDGRTIQDRQADLSRLIDRVRRGSSEGTAMTLLQLYNGGAVPSSANKVYLGNPVTIGFTDQENAVPTIQVDETRSIPVIMTDSAGVIGDIVPAAYTGADWVAARRTPACGCCYWWCPGATTTTAVGPINVAPHAIGVLDSVFGYCPMYRVSQGNSGFCQYTGSILVNYPGANGCPAVKGFQICYWAGEYSETLGPPDVTYAFWVTWSILYQGTGSPTTQDLCPAQPTPQFPATVSLGSAGAGGLLAAGIYRVAYTYYQQGTAPTGEGVVGGLPAVESTVGLSESLPFTVVLGMEPTITFNDGALPSCSTARNIYQTGPTGASGTETWYDSNATGSTYQITSDSWAHGLLQDQAPAPPTSTATNSLSLASCPVGPVKFNGLTTSQNYTVLTCQDSNYSTVPTAVPWQQTISQTFDSTVDPSNYWNTLFYNLYGGDGTDDLTVTWTLTAGGPIVICPVDTIKVLGCAVPYPNCPVDIYASEGGELLAHCITNVNGEVVSNITFSATLTDGSETVVSITTLPTGVVAGATVTGAGIPAGTTVSAITNATTFTLSENATTTGPSTLVANSTGLGTVWVEITEPTGRFQPYAASQTFGCFMTAPVTIQLIPTEGYVCAVPPTGQFGACLLPLLNDLTLTDSLAGDFTLSATSSVTYSATPYPNSQGWVFLGDYDWPGCAGTCAGQNIVDVEWIFTPLDHNGSLSVAWPNWGCTIPPNGFTPTETSPFTCPPTVSFESDIDGVDVGNPLASLNPTQNIFYCVVNSNGVIGNQSISE